jgi:hypothetical protein
MDVLRGPEPDTLLVTLPGMQAEFAAKALTVEGLTCLLECDGLKRLRYPNQEPPEPLAVTWPVSIYVARTQRDQAREILASTERTDVIGDQWAGRVTHAPPRSRRPQQGSIARAEQLPMRPTQRVYPGPRAEGTGLRFLVLAALAGLLLYALRVL